MEASRRQNGSIEARLARLVLVCVVPMFVVIAVLIHSSHQARREQVEQNMVAAARALTLGVDRELASIQAALRSLATSPYLRSGELGAFHTQTHDVLRGFTEADIILADASGQQLVNSYRPFGQALPRRNVPGGMQKLFDSRQAVVTDLFFGAVTKRPLISIDIPAPGTGGATLDLAMTIPAKRLAPILAEQNLPPGWHATLLDGTGAVVARTYDADRFIGKRKDAALLAKLAVHPDSVIDGVDIDGIEVYFAASQSAVSDWSVAVAMPKALLERQLDIALSWAVAGGVAALALGVALAMGTARGIAHAIQSLVGPANALGHGEPVVIVAQGFRETAELGEALLDAASLLQQRAGERDQAEAELAKREAFVRRQSEELKLSNAELEQFAYVASHDLREPLRMVSSFVSLLERRYADKLDAEGHEFIAFAKDGAERMNQLILDLLEFSRVGRSLEAPQSVNLTDAAREAASNLGMLIEDNGARVTVVDDMPDIFGVRSEWVRLFQNLIGNAIKYRAPSRPPEVAVTWRRDASSLVISVADNGIGIDPIYAERIFGLFQRLHTRDHYEGTGIGLAVCKKIVEQGGGKIRVVSQLDHGSEFLVILPAADAA
jgi:signal transduction histidine kinase